jgi:hypothetical protein
MVTKEDITQCLDLIDRALTVIHDHNNPDEVSGKITEYVTLLAMTAEMFASSKNLMKVEQGKLAEQYSKSGLGANERKQIIEGKTADLIYLVDKTDRQNAALTHAIDGLRSQLSFIKADMERARFAT